MPHFGAIVLAAGLSSRMGDFKLLLPWVDQRPILLHTIEKLQTLDLTTVKVVIGHRAEDVRDALSAYAVDYVRNSNYEHGEIISSVQAGLRELPQNTDAVLVVPGDMPLIRKETYQTILNNFEMGTILSPTYHQKRGHPVVFAREFWSELLDLPIPNAPRIVLQRNPEHVRLISVDDEGILIDLDIEETYQHELAREKKRIGQESP